MSEPHQPTDTVRYDAQEAIALLVNAHAKRSPGDHRADITKAAHELWLAVIAAAEEAGFQAADESNNEKWIGVRNHGVKLGLTTEGVWLRFGAGVAVYPEIEYDASTKLFVGTKVESFAEPGRAPKRRNAVTVVVEKFIELFHVQKSPER